MVPDAHSGTARSPEPHRHGGNREKPGGNGIHALQLAGVGLAQSQLRDLRENRSEKKIMGGSSPGAPSSCCCAAPAS